MQQAYNLTNLWLAHMYLIKIFGTKKLTAGIPNGQSDDQAINIQYFIILYLKFKLSNQKT